jgi:membrane-bound lytic murein transglycosylase A
MQKHECSHRSWINPRLKEPAGRFLLSFVIVIFMVGCTSLFEREVRKPEDALVRLRKGQFPQLLDDVDPASLRQAVQGSIDYFRSLPQDRPIVFGPDKYTASHMVTTLETFLAFLEEAHSKEDLERLVSTQFNIYRSVGRGWRRQVLFTGYYEPIVEGSLTQDERHPFPLYRKPDELITAWLGKFNPKFQGERVIGRLDGSELIPFYTRQEIDGEGVLADRGYEIAWLSDRIDRFFLQIQGSGMVRLDDGALVRVNYAAANGRPYRSIGKLLIDRGEVSREEMSMQRIRSYLDDHPEQLEEILSHNPSYVFFRIAERGPLGNISVPLTGGRSIATDSRLFPKGALAFIVSEKPVIDEKGKILRWEPFSRFVVNQDTGGAIRGPARVDLFWGEGKTAEIAAGHMKQMGKLFFLVKK